MKGTERMKHVEKNTPVADLIGTWVSRNVMLVGLVLLVAGCAPAAHGQRAKVQAGERTLVLLTRDGCPATASMRRNLDGALKSLGTTTSYELLNLDTLPVTDVRRGYPTPTLLFDSRDVFDLPQPAPPLPEPT